MVMHFKKFIYLFYLFIFWLCWVFLAVHVLSLVVASGGYSSLPCAGFSLRWLLLLQSSMGSSHVGFSSCGSRALERRLSSCGLGFIAPWHVGTSWTRARTRSPALAGRFLTTVPPGKPSNAFFNSNLLFTYLFLFLFLAVLGLRFCARAFSSCSKRGPLFIAVRGPLHYRGLSCCGVQAPDAQAQ